MTKTATEIEAEILADCAKQELIAHLRRQIAPRLAKVEARRLSAEARRAAFAVVKKP